MNIAILGAGAAGMYCGSCRGDNARASALTRARDHITILTLPTAMFIGLAPLLRRELNCKIVCELTGEDIFLEAMPQPGRDQVRQQIQQRCADIDTFISTSHYYARHMAEYLSIPEGKIA